MTETSIKSKTANYSQWVRRMGSDNRMQATHVSLFTALFVLWHQSGFTSHFMVSRKKLMAFSRIASIATYHKCIRELDTFGYIRYQPSYHPIMGSLIWWPLEPEQSPDQKKEPGNPA